jgi:dipeptidyl aminopeptidase/acylaminoacyl peptidase
MLSKFNAREKPFDIGGNLLVYEAQVKAIIDYFMEEQRYDSINRFGGNNQGVTYRWVNSIIDKRSFNYYENINIPVLFIHGLLDIFVPPISTKYVEENLPDKPFDYIYYPDSQHYPTTVRELERMRTDIANWLRENGL